MCLQRTNNTEFADNCSGTGSEVENHEFPDECSEIDIEEETGRTLPSESSLTGGENDVTVGGDFPVDLFKNLRMKLAGPFKDPLNMTVTCSVGEILTNVLTLVKKHNWNHSEKEDLMKFTNALFNKKVVPSSRYLLDKYFYSKEGMRYHFFCSQCAKLLLDICATQHTQTHIRCSNPKCLKVNVISDLSKCTYFVTYDLPSQLQLLLDDPAVRRKLVCPTSFVKEPEDGMMYDLHHGSAYRSFANYVHKLPNPHHVKYISLSLSVGSASLCSGFSGQSICPCFIMINELPPVLRMKNLLIGGLWFGLEKERMDLFLPPIVQHITSLSSKGFSLQFHDEVWQVKAYLIACVADSVARCDVQGIHSHRGDFPCNWCLCEGEETGTSRIFRYKKTLPPPRTIKGMLQDAKQAEEEKNFVRGVKYLCLLSAAPLFHPVHGFVVDQMHAKDEGTTKSFLHAWLGEDGKTKYYIGKPNIRKLNSLLRQVKIPRELRKSVRSLNQLSYWTGREMENWALFLSLSLLPGILPTKYLNHWALYVQGTYLLLNCELHSDVVNIAEDMLEEFCSKTEELYGKHMMRFNLHILRHFAQNCRRWGPLFALSAYAFEAAIQRLKKLVHDCNGIPNQICRGMSEVYALAVLRESSATPFTEAFEKSVEPKSHSTRVKFVDKIELLGISRSFKPSKEEKWYFDKEEVNVEDCVEYNLLKKEGCHYGPGASSHETMTDNSYARLKNTNIICIKKIIHNERTNDIWIIGNRVRVEPSQFCPQSILRYDFSLCCQFSVTSIDENVDIYTVSDLSTVCVNLEVDNAHFISPLPNIFNMY